MKKSDGKRERERDWCCCCCSSETISLIRKKVWKSGEKLHGEGEVAGGGEEERRKQRNTYITEMNRKGMNTSALLVRCNWLDFSGVLKPVDCFGSQQQQQQQLLVPVSQSVETSPRPLSANPSRTPGCLSQEQGLESGGKGGGGRRRRRRDKKEGKDREGEERNLGGQILSFFPLWALVFVWQFLLVDWEASSIISVHSLQDVVLVHHAAVNLCFLFVCVCVLGVFFCFIVPYTLDSLWAFFVFQLFWTLSRILSLSLSLSLLFATLFLQLWCALLDLVFFFSLLFWVLRGVEEGVTLGS